MHRARRVGLAALLAMTTACGRGPACESPDAILSTRGEQTLSCADADVVVDWVELLAGRSADKQTRSIREGLVSRFDGDPSGTRAWLGELKQAADELGRLEGFAAAEARSRAVYRMAKGQGRIREEDGGLWSGVDSAVAVWATHEGDGLALTEADIEGWIYYGSLCREVQGAGVLRISVADRVSIYGTLRDRWEYGSKTDRVALAAMGPFWQGVRERWQSASYEQQQNWALSAPLPPPMTATSLGYLAAILEGDLTGHAATLHGHLGPLRLDR